MVINHNLSSLFANRQVGLNEAGIAKGIAAISSGQRINKAGDDASGLAVSEKMRSQIRGLNQANRNIQNGISFLQTTEGYLQETTDILQRIRELSVQSANGIYSAEDRAMTQIEVSSLIAEVDRIASQAQFNGLNLLTGRFAESGLQLQVGANADQFATVTVKSATAESLGLKNEQGLVVDLSTQEGANSALATIDNALKNVNSQRSALGAFQNRFETASKGIGIAAENLTAAESRIRDTDVASALVEYTKDQILTNASLSMLAQAQNQNRDSVLLLLR